MTRILQFTDLHSRQALPGHSGHSERLSRHGPKLLAALKLRIAEENPDLIAFTGDIIDAPHDLLHGTGNEDDRATLIEAVRQDYLAMRGWLDGLGRRWLIAPGNHDFRPVFLDVFADAARSVTLPHVTAVSYYDWEVRDNTAERLDEERARFDTALAQARPDGWTLHLHHFLIWPEVPHGYPMRYREADELRDRLAVAAGRHMVLSGHFHEGTGITQCGNGSYAVCTSMTEAPHRYRVFDFTSDDCTMREERLPSGPLAGRPVLLIDRTDVLTEEPAQPGADYVLKQEALFLFEKVLEIGYLPVLVSAWNDPASENLLWADMLKRHDRLFLALARQGCPQGAGLVIALDEELPLPLRLPSEPLPRYADLVQRICTQYGAEVAQVMFLSRSASRRQRLGGARSIASIDELTARQEIPG